MGKKSFGFVMLALMALLTIIMPVSANVVGTIVNQGATVFVGEEGLNIVNAMGGSTSIGWWAAGSNLDTTSPSKSLLITSGMQSSYTISPSQFSSFTGNWYRLTSGGTIDPSHTVAFYVTDPQISMDIWNTQTSQSVNGKSVARGTPLTFRIDTNIIMNENSPTRQRVGTTGTSHYAPVANFTVSGNDVAWRVTDASTNSPTHWNWSIKCDGCSEAACNYTGLSSVLTNYHSGTYTVILESWNDINANGAHSIISGHVIVNAISACIESFTILEDPDPSYSEEGSISAGYLNPSADGFITVRVKSESGASYTSLYTTTVGLKSLSDMFVNSSTFYWGGVSNSANSFKWDTGHKTGSQYDYPAGTYQVYAESNLNRMKENYRNGGADYTGKTVTPTYTVTIGSDSLTLDISKESVVRGNGFSVTLTGQPLTAYTLGLKGTSALESGSGEKPPMMVQYQEGVTPIDGSLYHATVITDSSGVRTVGFTTNNNTQEHKFTIRANSSDTTKYDEVTINVAQGTLTLMAEGSQNYYLGEEIKFSGINTETNTVYMFITGPNLNSNGAQITNPSAAVVSGDESTFVTVDVDGEDDTYKFDWSTATVDLDAGTYTIYAVSQPNAKSDLSDSAYATTSIVIKKPFVKATAPTTVAKGDKIIIEGSATGEPQSVKIWILGKNYVKIATQSVDSDSTYKYEIPFGVTTDMASGQYFIVVQHPMQNAVFDIYEEDGYVGNRELGGDIEDTYIFKLEGAGSLQGTDAAEALVEAINDPNIDDTYTKLNFMLSEPVIAIDPIGDKHIGDKFTLTAKTNLAIDDEVLIEIYSSSFGPTVKTKSGEFSGITGNVKVTKGDSGDGLNRLSLDIDASSFKADEYIVLAQGLSQDATGTALFRVIEFVPTPVPTAVPTPIVTAAPITVPPTVPPTVVQPTVVPTTTKSPGFGAVIALSGLMIVGFIVSRRD